MEAGREWALDLFGRPGPTIRSRIPALVRTEHGRCVGAQEEWGHDSQLVYGAFWSGIIDLFKEFAALEGGALMRPGRATYKLPVINGVTLFPWRFARSADAEVATTPFATSPARMTIPSLRQGSVQDPLLEEFSPPLELTEDDEKLLETFDAVQRDAKTNNRLVLVAIASSVTGLHRLDWGEVALTEEGFLEPIGFTESLLPVTRTGPASTSPGATFTDGSLPRRRVEVREADVEPPADE